MKKGSAGRTCLGLSETQELSDRGTVDEKQVSETRRRVSTRNHIYRGRSLGAHGRHLNLFSRPGTSGRLIVQLPTILVISPGQRRELFRALSVITVVMRDSELESSSTRARCFEGTSRMLRARASAQEIHFDDEVNLSMVISLSTSIQSVLDFNSGDHRGRTIPVESIRNERNGSVLGNARAVGKRMLIILVPVLPSSALSPTWVQESTEVSLLPTLWTALPRIPSIPCSTLFAAGHAEHPLFLTNDAQSYFSTSRESRDFEGHATQGSLRILFFCWIPSA